jgi:hypothetical protein
MEMNVDDFLAIGEVIRQARVQGARARDVRQQILHLVSQHTSTL